MPRPKAATPAAAPRFVSAKYLAQMLSVTEKTVYDWTDAGKLPPSIPVGTRRRRWNLDEVLRHLEQSRKEARNVG